MTHENESQPPCILMANDIPDYNVNIKPKWAGGYQLGGPGGLKIMLAKRPSWFNRKMMNFILGLEWVDNE